MPEILFLGTAAGLPTVGRSYTSLAILDEGVGMLVDCGANSYQGLLEAGVSQERISDLFLTHAHIDHIGGLPSFLVSLRRAKRQTPLRLWALPETLETVEGLLRLFAQEFPQPLEYTLELRPLQGAGELPPIGPAAFAFLPMEHSIPAAGLRLTFPRSDGSAWSVVYSGDTRPTAALEQFAQGCDLLILECTYLDRDREKAWQVGHMTALQAGQLAQRAQAKALALVHLWISWDYPGWEQAQVYEEAAQAFRGQLRIPQDGERFHF
jgi:ribonuclease Z